MLTQTQVQASNNVETLLDTATDCLRFVTGFFDPIRQSALHIYHSALLLAPQSSIVQKLNSQHISNPIIRIVHGVPALWDSCTAHVGHHGRGELGDVAWSSCGQFIATAYVGEITIRDSNTLEDISTLRPPDDLLPASPYFLTFSYDGHLLACSYCNR